MDETVRYKTLGTSGQRIIKRYRRRDCCGGQEGVESQSAWGQHALLACHGVRTKNGRRCCGESV
jgi:hypothetical protein